MAIKAYRANLEKCGAEVPLQYLFIALLFDLCPVVSWDHHPQMIALCYVWLVVKLNNSIQTV